MTNITKTMLGTVAAGAMALGSATPAIAADRYDRDRGIDAGDVIAGAVILGGIAAVISATSKKDRYEDRRYRDRNYSGDRYDRSAARRAVEQCVRATERNAQRYGYRYADVTEIRDVERTRYGWEVKGRLAVDNGRYSSRDRYGYNSRANYDQRAADTGRFTCDVEGGRVVDIDYKGIRGLR